MSEKVIIAKDLTRKFGNFIATNAISFEVEKGEIFGFLGANGAGKTTAMKMLCGLLTPTSGSATVAGYDVGEQADEVKKHIGYMSQKFSMYEDLTVKENFLFYGGVYGIKRAEILDRLNKMLSRLDLENVLDSMVVSLPLGWKQKLSFSLAVLHRPQVVFLDEPTDGVDPITRRQFWDLIYEAANNDVTIFVTTHYMDEAEYCDRVSIMVDGKIEALDSPGNLRKMYNAKHMDEVFHELARGTSNR